MRFDVLTLFPGIFASFLEESLLKSAIDNGLVQVSLHNIRDWAHVPCVEDVQAAAPAAGRLLLMSPQGRRLDQPLVEELAGEERILLLCGRYEGFDERIIEILRPQEISLGDFILNGGEVAAMAVIESVIRLIPGVLGDADSARFDSFSSGNRILEEPQYTRPREYRGYEVPEILLSGDHGRVDRWRAEQRVLRTQERRPDLLEGSDAENPPPPREKRAGRNNKNK